MPSRLACIALLVYWLVAAVGLARRDLLPELSVGAPPDLRVIASAGEGNPPARWTIQAVDDPDDPESARSVGQAVTQSRRAADNSATLTSQVTFDSGRLLSGLFRSGVDPGRSDRQIAFDSVFHVNPSGDLRSFHAEVRIADQPGELWRVDGALKGSVLEVVTRGPLPIMNRTFSFAYQPREVVQSQFGPLDRLPGLQVGQRWDERVASPLTGQVETVRVEVAKKAVIHWDKSPVSTFEVVHRSKAVSARTWVRPDGLVLRQEVVLPAGRLRLVLERQADREAAAPPAGTR
jgi:hypothetical protein